MGRLIDVMAPMADDVALAGYNYLRMRRKVKASQKAAPVKKEADIEKTAYTSSAEAFYDLTRRFSRGMRYGRMVSPVAHVPVANDILEELEETPPIDKKEPTEVKGA